MSEEVSKIIKISHDLIKFRTTPDNFAEMEKCLDYITSFFSDDPLIIKKFSSQNIHSLVISPTDSTKNNLLFVTHIDIVSGPEFCFKPKIKDEKLYGRGAWDMKVFVALMMVLMKELVAKSKRNIGLMITTDEGLGGQNGTLYLLEKEKYTCDLAFIPEGNGDFAIINTQKGFIHFKIKTTGKTAHGSKPWLGENAIDKLIDIYERIRRLFPNQKNNQEWRISCNIGWICGGNVINQVPDSAEMNIDLRYPEDYTADNILRMLRKITEDSPIEIITKGAPCYIPEDNRYLQSYKKIAENVLKKEILMGKEHSSSDARFFSDLGIPVIINRSPGGGSHSNNEWVEIEPLGDFYQILREFILSL